MTDPTPDPAPRSRAPSPPSALVAGHLAFGWWTLFLFLVLGIALEALHSLKIGFYLDHSNETRRLLWRLSHAHGTLLALVHIGFALSLPSLSEARGRSLLLASRCLYAGAIALPLGFFLGGVFVYGGDPGPAIVLAPVGSLLSAVAVLLIALATAVIRAHCLDHHLAFPLVTNKQDIRATVLSSVRAQAPSAPASCPSSPPPR